MSLTDHKRVSVAGVADGVGQALPMGVAPGSKPRRPAVAAGVPALLRGRDGRPAWTPLRRALGFSAWPLAGCVLLSLSGCVTEPAPVVPQLTRADRVVVKKGERKMQLVQQGQVVREYRIALGDQPRGHKVREGDERTPEGLYFLDWRNPYSSYYKSIHVSYPNARDIQYARNLGVKPGGMIMIHGQPNYLRSEKVQATYQYRDWTNGCIAVQNHEMDEIWTAVRDGTPIEILP